MNREINERNPLKDMENNLPDIVAASSSIVAKHGMEKYLELARQSGFSVLQDPELQKDTAESRFGKIGRILGASTVGQVTAYFLLEKNHEE